LLLRVLVSEETRVQAAFPTASARLANLARGGSLLRISENAYCDAAARLLPTGPAPRAARQIRAECRYLATRSDSAVVTLHWEVIGAGAVQLPVLDADVTVVPAGDQTTLLRFDGAYPAPLGAAGGGPDSIVLHHVASATIRMFAGRIADLITAPDALP
jgi:hypothetical protein